MSEDMLMALAQFAGQTVVAAAVTDVWETVRSRFAQLLGRGDPRRTQVAEHWLTQTRDQLIVLPASSLKLTQEAHAERWAGRFADLLDENPSSEAELRALVAEVAELLPANAAWGTDHSVTSGRDVTIVALGGGTAAGVIHGNVAPPDPYQAGFGTALAGPGLWDMSLGSIGADRGGVAVGKLELQRRPDMASMPVRLAPRPVFLAGREVLLASLDAQLQTEVVSSGPRIAVLCGLGGAGKTSVALEYAHRHLAELGLVWQFTADDPTTLASGFRLALGLAVYTNEKSAFELGGSGLSKVLSAPSQRHFQGEE